MTSIDDRTDAAPSDAQSVAQRLLDSSEMLSYDPMAEVDWATPLDKSGWACSPEWITLYGTDYWHEMTREQQRELSRQEVASVGATGIWFEMILQQLVLRDFYAKDPGTPEFRWAITEIGDECRHTVMFAHMIEKLGGTGHHRPSRAAIELGRLFKTTAFGEGAYAAILVAEEVLDVMQRDWMRDERVVPFMRTVNNIHVVEESRHMKFAREETKERMRSIGGVRRRFQAAFVALAAWVIVDSMVTPRAYKAAGLDVKRAVREARANENHQAMVRSSLSGLMEFLHSAGLLTKTAKRIYRRADLI